MTILKKVLITGAHGFLGRNVAMKFKQHGYTVMGIGHGTFSAGEEKKCGIDVWSTLPISTQNLRNMEQEFDVIVHCAGGSKVASSLDNPAQDFHNTVSITIEILEFIRLYSPKSRLIYPSSAAVYGEHDNSPISVNEALIPASPYGEHKKIAEQMCLSYNKFFNCKVSIIRFFSIYGPGLTKQLIWDACKKMSLISPKPTEQYIFWGVGTETRDWIYISDAVNLIFLCAEYSTAPLIMNGGSGVAVTIQDTLIMLGNHLDIDTQKIQFNGAVKSGDPRHYCADMESVSFANWRPEVPLDIGLANYANWFKSMMND